MSNTAVGVPVALRGVHAAFDVERVRADFPILRRQVRGRALTYLDNAATTQKPRQVIDARPDSRGPTIDGRTCGAVGPDREPQGLGPVRRPSP